MKTHKLILFLLLTFLLIGCKKEDPFDKNSKIVAHDFLSEENYDELIIEIVYVNGQEPTQQAVDHLVTVLSQRLNKPKGVKVIKKSIPSPGFSSYSISRIKEIEEEHRTSFPKRHKLGAYIFFADAGYEGDQGNQKSLGVAYGTTSMAIFEQTVKDYSGGLGQPSTHILEATVMLHEFGHVLGLVNNGSLMQTPHQDLPNGHHCDNQNCIMYYAAETTDIIGFLTGETVPGFDANCLADLSSNGGR